MISFVGLHDSLQCRFSVDDRKGRYQSVMCILDVFHYFVFKTFPNSDHINI